MNRAARLAIPLLVLGLLTVACGGKKGTTAASPKATTATTATSNPPAGGGGELAGTWNGTYDAQSGITGTFTVRFTQTGTALTGTIQIQDSPCVSQGTISGAISGNQISFGALQGQGGNPEALISFTGTVNGNQMSGDFQSADCNDSGTWTATKG